MQPVPSFRVLQTCFSRSWGGLEIQALEVSMRLRQHGHRVHLACCTGSRLAHEASDNGVPVLALPVKGYMHPIVIGTLQRFLRANAIDIIHCQLSKDIALLVPAMLLSGRRTPVVLSKRVGSYLSKKDILHRFTYRYVNMALAISEVIRRNILETTPLTKERVMTLHDAVDPQIFSQARVDRSAVRMTLQIPSDVTVIGFVGRFSPGKGHEELLHAVHELRKTHHRLRLLIVGEASYGEEQYEKKIRELSARLELSDLVSFEGFRNDIPEIMSVFDIFAFPSHAEAFGVALIEAMAMECPVVASNCDGVLDIVVDGETGVLVPPRDAAALTKALDQLIRDGKMRERMGKAGRSRVQSLFDQEKQIGRLEEVYRTVIDVSMAKQGEVS